MIRYYLCDLEDEEGKKKNAYIKEKNATVGNVFRLQDHIWKVISVGKLSVSEGILEKLQGTEKIGYKEKK